MKRPGKSCVPQLGVVPRKKWHILVYAISQDLCSRSPFRHTSCDNVAHVQSQRSGQT